MKKSENKANEEAKIENNQDNKDKPIPRDVVLEVQDVNIGQKKRGR